MSHPRPLRYPRALPIQSTPEGWVLYSNLNNIFFRKNGWKYGLAIDDILADGFPTFTWYDREEVKVGPMLYQTSDEGDYEVVFRNKKGPDDRRLIFEGKKYKDLEKAAGLVALYAHPDEIARTKTREVWILSGAVWNFDPWREEGRVCNLNPFGPEGLERGSPVNKIYEPEEFKKAMETYFS